MSDYEKKYLKVIFNFINIKLNDLSSSIDDIHFGHVPYNENDLSRFEGSYEAFYSIRKLILSYLEGNDD